MFPLSCIGIGKLSSQLDVDHGMYTVSMRQQSTLPGKATTNGSGRPWSQLLCVRDVPERPEHVEVTVVALHDGPRRRSTGGSRLPRQQRVVPVDVEAARPHEAALPGREPRAEEALEGRLGGGAHEEGVPGHEVERRDVEAHGLHHVPRQLPEREPHEPDRLRRHKAQPAPQLPPRLRRRVGVDGRLLRLQRLQLFLLLLLLLLLVGVSRARRRRMMMTMPRSRRDREDGPDGSGNHVGAEEDRVAEDDDAAGLVQRAGQPAPTLDAAGNVGAERGELRPGHDALRVGPQPRPRRLHLRRPRHLPRLLHRHAEARLLLRRRPRHSRLRRQEPVEAEAVEELVADGEGGEAVRRERDGHGAVPDVGRAGPQECQCRAVIDGRQRSSCRSGGGLGSGADAGGSVLAGP
ncbi:hypothetical protein QOZ80_3AG0239620 [Eleusine coracana subsp. coracana]|nr:hypothetical protein QOZ80_3AG0239620 [Eleusine coracana subsp. coracana]